MPGVVELLADLKQSGIRLTLDDAGQLRWSGPRDALTQEFRERIRWLRRHLVETLAAKRSGRAAATTSPAPPSPMTPPPSPPRPDAHRAHHDDGHDRDPHDRVGNAPRREERRTLVRSLMDGQRCADCGIAYPWYVMTLDDGSGQKVDILRRLANRKASMATILAEVRKCEPVCLNCRAARLHHRSDPREGLGSRAGMRWKIWDEKSELRGHDE